MNNFPVTFLFTLVALVLLLVMAWLILKWLARLSVNKNGGEHLAVSSVLQLGSREKIVAVKYRNCELLLGVTGSSISLLDKQPLETGEISAS